MQLKYHDQALQNNVHVIGTCGFDSIPADMGVVFATEQFPGEYILRYSTWKQPYACWSTGLGQYNC